MGEAKRKSATQSNVIYPHSSILVTNRIWMDGVLKPDGLGTDIIQHPKIEGGVRFGGEKVRRACQDFPPLVWFTTQIAMPKCMQSVELTLRFPNSVQDEGKLREELDQF